MDGRAVGLLIGAVGGTAFVVFNAPRLPAAVGVPLAVLAVAALVGLVVVVLRRRSAPGGDAAADRPGGGVAADRPGGDAVTDRLGQASGAGGAADDRLGPASAAGGAETDRRGGRAAADLRGGGAAAGARGGGGGGAAVGGAGMYGRGYRLVVVGEVLALVVGVVVLGRLGLGSAVLGWVAFVVGAHFVALGRIWRQAALAVVGAVVAVAGGVGFALALAGAPDPALALVAGVVPGATLLAGSWWAAL